MVILDYIKEIKSKTFNELPFNNIDALVFANLSYINNTKEDFKWRFTVNDWVCKFINSANKYKRAIFPKDDLEFCYLIKNSVRYSNLKVCHFEEIHDELTETQFAVLTIKLDKKNLCVCFSGTDSTLLGWKDDLNLAIYEETNSQKLANEYLLKIIKKFPFKKINVLGHSKGGNLAIYSSIKIPENKQKRINKIYNFDGPGIKETYDYSDLYQNVNKKITTFIPYRSLFGIIFNPSSNVKIISSINKGIMQHSLYGWEIENYDFKYIDELSNSSKNCREAIKRLLEKTSLEDKQKVISSLYEVLTINNLKTTREIAANLKANIKAMFNAFSSLDKDKKSTCIKTLNTFILDYIKISISKYGKRNSENQ